MKKIFLSLSILLLFAGGVRSEVTIEEKAERMANFFAFEDISVFDVMTLHQGRQLHEHLRGISFSEANHLIRSGELSEAYKELQDLLVEGERELLLELAIEGKEQILANFSDEEINSFFSLLPKEKIRYLNDLSKLDPLFEKHGDLMMMIYSFKLSDEYMLRREFLYQSKEYRKFIHEGFDNILTKHGYPLVISIDAEADIKGMWTHIRQKGEIVEITRQGEGFVATKKVSTDDYVPQGEKTFFFDLDFNNCQIQFAQENFTNPFLVDCKVFEISEDRIVLSGPAGMGGFQLKRKF